MTSPYQPHAPTPPPGCPAHTAGGQPAPLYGTAVSDDPHAMYEQLRSRFGPVAPVELAPGVRAWLVLGYRELQEVARNEEFYSKDSRRWRELREGRVGPGSPLLPFVVWRPTCYHNDGPEFVRMRAAVTASLACMDHRSLRLTVKQLADELIDAWSAGQVVDLREQYARHLPPLVFTRVLGLPDHAGADLLDAVARLSDAGRDAVAANAALEQMMRRLIEDKKADPGQDLTSWLLGHPSHLSDVEVLHHLVVILVAACETTVNWIGTALKVMLTDSRFHQSLTAGRLTVSDALDEVLWRETPTQNLPGRFAKCDLTLGGRHIHEGDLLVFGLAAANQDPSVAPAADQISGSRSYASFGGGAHACPGQDHARLIAQTAVETFLRRCPDAALAVPGTDLTWRSSPWSRALKALPTIIPTIAPRPAQEAPLWNTPRPRYASTPAAATSTPKTPNSAKPARSCWWNSLTAWWRGL